MADDTKAQAEPVQANEETIETVAPAESAKEAAEVLKEAPKVEAKSPSTQVIDREAQTESAAQDKKAVSASLEKISASLDNPSLNRIIEQIEKLSVLELADLVHALEDRFGVSAAAPMAVATAPAAGGGEQVEEQTTFNVILASGGANKIAVIKAVRELVQTLGLKEAKDLVEAAPKLVLEGVNKERANEAKTKLTAAGATVELK